MRRLALAGRRAFARRAKAALQSNRDLAAWPPALPLQPRELVAGCLGRSLAKHQAQGEEPSGKRKSEARWLAPCGNQERHDETLPLGRRWPPSHREDA